MKTYILKSRRPISLIVIIFCILLSYVNNYFDISGFISTKAQAIKEKQMEFIYGRHSARGDSYISNSPGYYGSNINYTEGREITSADSIPVFDYTDFPDHQSYTKYMVIKNSGQISELNEFLIASKTQSISKKLQDQIDKDSFRHWKLGFYYVFNYDYTIGALKELDVVIESTSQAQKVPKALVAAVLFREMMFLGQEDILDGLPLIGGKSLGICQIGIQNVRYNEKIVHGDKSLIINKTDDDIKEMLENPERAVYFCAVQLRARAIKITQDQNVDLNSLDKEQIHRILEEYNQSNISVSVGPIKSKHTYAKETYRYYELFDEYYNIQ